MAKTIKRSAASGRFETRVDVGGDAQTKINQIRTESRLTADRLGKDAAAFEKKVREAVRRIRDKKLKASAKQ